MIQVDEEAGTRVGATARVMVVEDDGLVASEVTRILRSLGYEVVTDARTGEEATRAAREKGADLALVDVQLSGDLDGIEAGEILHREVGIPVVYVTAHADDVTRERARRTTPYGYLLKPFGKRELQVSVEVALVRHRMERRLRASRDRYRRVFEGSVAGMFRTDTHGELLEVNRSFVRMLGYDRPEALTGLSDAELYRDPDVRDEVHRRVAREGEVRNLEVRAVDRDDRDVWLLMSAARIEDPLEDEPVVLGTAVEIGRRKAMEERLEDIAHHDDLTGLANRRLLEEKAEQTLALSERGEGRACLLYLDLDGFKRINDRLGHRAGDEVLIRVAERLEAAARGTDVVARVGGDEFVVLLAEVDGREAARAAARRLVDRVGGPLEVDGRELRVEVCAGVALHRTHGESFGELLEAADHAMYEAKRKDGARVSLAREEEGEDGADRSDLGRILEEDRLVLHYQPLRRSDRGDLVGVEALARWDHPDGSLVPARAFLSGMERQGLGARLDRRVLELAADQLGRWSADSSPAWVAVNVTPASLRSEALLHLVDELGESRGLDPSRLVLEVSERTTARSLADLAPRLRRLRALGARIALDDYGAGESSVAQLRDLPVDLLKIDRSLVAGGGLDRDLAEGLIRLGRHLGLQVAVEGVETGAQIGWAADVGADLVQGHAAGSPVPAGEI